MRAKKAQPDFHIIPCMLMDIINMSYLSITMNP